MDSEKVSEFYFPVLKWIKSTNEPLSFLETSNIRTQDFKELTYQGLSVYRVGAITFGPSENLSK